MDEDCDLDALMDVLNEDDDLTEETIEKPTSKDAKELEKLAISLEAAAGPNLSKKQSKHSNEASQSNDNENHNNEDAEEDDEDLQRQLQQMEEQMRKMKEKLKNKNKSQNSPPKAAAKPKLGEIDMFSASVQSPKSSKRGLTSPVKTNPLSEAERASKPAKFEANSTNWCPSLMRKDSERTLGPQESSALKKRLAQIDSEKDMIRIAKQDLADSSDDQDEDGNDRYNQYGKEMKRRIAKASANGSGFPVPTSSGASQQTSKERLAALPGRQGSFTSPPGTKNGVSSGKTPSKERMLVEKNSGLRISRPKVSLQELDSASKGRKTVQMSMLQEVIRMGSLKDTDWVTFGVLYYKTEPKNSKNGNDYSIWKMTDLKGEMRTVSVFMFSKAHKAHWKMPINKVVGLLNPKVMEDRAGSISQGQAKNEVQISIDHPDKVMELGDSVDIGKCAFKKPDGGNCQNLVHKQVCEFCTYHVKRAYKDASGKRSGLQSSYSGGPDMTRQRLMNKMHPSGKGEVFGGGQIMNFKPVVGKNSSQQIARDERLMRGLGGVVTPVAKAFSKDYLDKKAVLLSDKQKDAVKQVAGNISQELASRMLVPTPGARAILSHLVKEEKVKEEVKPAKTGRELLKEEALARAAEVPMLGRGLKKGGSFSLDVPSTVKGKFSLASQSKALAILAAKKANIVKEDPNRAFTSKSKNATPERREKVKKRVAACLDSDSDEENEAVRANKKARRESGNLSDKSRKDSSASDDSGKKVKKPKTVVLFGKEVNVEELEKTKTTKSKNLHLVEEAELDATDQYFDKLEKKEAMEEKMGSTFEMKVKAAYCSTCEYTAYSASEKCRQEGHRIKSIDATKRFFSCKGCKKRTTSLDRLPREACKQCGGNNWVKAGMMGERKGPKLGGETLSIRGMESTFMGSTSMVGANINL